MPKARKAIPTNLADIILYKAARTCCVCRIPRAPVELHHIDEDPSNNVESNIIATCRNCHDEAHTKHTMSQNLTIARLINFKTQWETEVALRSSTAMLPASVSNALQDAMWTYVNHQKLPDLIKLFSIKLNSNTFKYLNAKGLIDKSSIPIFQRDQSHEILTTIYDRFEWDDSRRLHSVYTDIVDEIILKANPIELGAIWTKREIKNIVKPGTICFCIRGFRFKSLKRVNHEEDRKVYAVSKGIEVRLMANTRHMYGSSALYDTFSGNRTVAILFVAKDVAQEDGRLVVSGTPIAMDAGFMLDEYKSPHQLKYRRARLA